MNLEPNVRPATRERVERAIELLNYSPDPAARRLAGQRSFLIGLLYDNPSPSYVINNQKGVLAQCRKHGLDLLIHPCDYLDPGLGKEIQRFVKQARPDGLVLTPPLSDQPQVIEALQASGTAFVCVGRGEPEAGISRISTNDEEMAFRMALHLLEKGHREIAFIKGHPDHKAVGFRERGFLRAMKHAGIVIREEFMAQGFNSFQSGLQVAKKLLALPRPPTAIFAANDDMAFGVIKAAYRAKVLVPEELSVAGFDDVPFASQVSPGLTTVRQPIRQMAGLAAETLIKSINDPSAGPVDLLIGGELVFRESTARLIADQQAMRS